MNQKNLVWVKVPYSDLEQEKIRPGIIISNNDYNSKNNDVVICAITSNLEQRPYSVFIDQKNLDEGHLQIPSKIKVDKIMQVEKTKILRAFAKLNRYTFSLVVKEVLKLVKE